MQRWLQRKGRVPDDARRRQVAAQAQAVLNKLREDGQPYAYVRSLEPFVTRAPEVLALGPAPASLTMRVIYGLCRFAGDKRERFLVTLREEFATPSPTLRAVVRSDLVVLDSTGTPQVTAAGRSLYQALREAGAFDHSVGP